MDDKLTPQTPNDVIDSTKFRAKCKTDKALAKRIGMIPQTLCNKRKHPGTFTGYEIRALAVFLNWTNEEISNFIRGIK